MSRADDRILAETRWASWVIVGILVAAFLILWVMPGRTAELWAWTIRPDMTAIFMGSGYGAGAYFFARVALARQWHPAAPGVLAAAIFAALMLVVTLIHFDRFNQGEAPTVAAASFYAWVLVYVLSPVLVGWLWWRNQQETARTRGAEVSIVPRSVRRTTRLIGALTIVGAIAVLISPSVAIDVWPWTLTLLTARVIACFVAQVGIGLMLLSLDERWSAWGLLLQTVLVATALLLVGTVRSWSDFDAGAVATWLFLSAVAGLALAVAALYQRRDWHRDAASSPDGRSQAGLP